MAKRLEFRSVVVDWSCIADVNFFKKNVINFEILIWILDIWFTIAKADWANTRQNQ